MDGLREPVGAQPPEVYWRRRVVAIVGAVLLVIVVYFLVFSPGGGTPEGTPLKSPDPTTNTAITTGPAAGATADANVTRACTTSDVTITATPNPFSFASGTLPVFDVSLTQSGTTPCLLDTGAADTEFVVWSGGENNKDIYYSTTYCPDDSTIAPRRLILQPGDDEPLQVTWSRQRVGTGCTPGSDPAAGYYWAQLTIQGIASEPAQFQLEG